MPAGSLTMYRRHSLSCPHRKKGRRWTNCKCGIWVQGSLGGEWLKESLSTRDWSAAAAVVHEWTASRQIGATKVDVPTIEKAIEKYFADAAARHLATTTIRKRRELVEGTLLPFCRDKGFHLLRQLDVDALRGFRNSWRYSALSATKRLEYLRGCHDAGWIDSNPAMVLKAPKVAHFGVGRQKRHPLQPSPYAACQHRLTNRAAEDSNRGSPDLHTRQESSRLGRERQGTLRAFSARLSKLHQPSSPGADDGDLGHGEDAVEEDQYKQEKHVH
jgi:hypothetical protein